MRNEHKRRSARLFELLTLLLLAGAASAFTSGVCQNRTPGELTAAASGSQQQPAHPLHKLGLMATREVTDIAVPNLKLTDQDGRRVKLYDLMKDKLVVLNFFYTTCQGVCPTTGLWLSKLQESLGERLGKDVVIISISIDPTVDTPGRIKQWGGRWKRQPGWTLLTSKDKAVDRLSNEFLAGELKGMHSPTVFVGDGRRNPVGWINVDILDESRILLNYFDQMKGR